MAKDSIKIVRLTTGEEVMCEVKEVFEGETRTGVKVNKPLLLVPTSIQNLTMIPWVFYTEEAHADGLFLKENNIIFIATPKKDLKAEYEKAFSKIVTPGKGDIITGGGADMNKLGSKLRLSTD